ncbi:hypothetical protein M422DRAFT_154796 [Sphaerobolus stellatus SS14]|nr:hypothetical protein M422DRAFT_154796 [Sphaerobolus stellatus SS14]
MIRSSALKGFQIENDIEKLIVLLFADDTTVFLFEHDKYSDLETILLTWCKASGAKFNLEKTTILPIGTKAYCDTGDIIKFPESKNPIKEGIHIAKDGEPVHVLGSFVGNKVNQVTVWTPIIETIESSLACWKKLHPTPDGKRIIIQIEFGGRTQYLTQVQGMPKDVENTLVKIIRGFLWGESKSPPINLETMYADTASGGKKILNIKVRNHAIELGKIKAYLNFGEN